MKFLGKWSFVTMFPYSSLRHDCVFHWNLWILMKSADLLGNLQIQILKSTQTSTCKIPKPHSPHISISHGSPPFLSTRRFNQPEIHRFQGCHQVWSRPMNIVNSYKSDHLLEGWGEFSDVWLELVFAVILHDFDGSKSLLVLLSCYGSPPQL